MIGETSLRKMKNLHGNLGGVKMNPVFWLLVVLGAVVLWFFLAFVFYPLGKFLWRIGSDAMEELDRNDKEEENDDL